jgi:ABC-2 type transport system ATP-binding protein
MNGGKIVMHGAVEEIQQRVFGTKKICISVLEDCEKATELIKNFPNTEIETVKNNNIVVEINAAEQELADLNSLLITNGVKVYNFSEGKTDLEDLFMKISSSEE